MKPSRLVQLSCSLAATLVLTACGGGGDTGPQWAQSAKNVLLYGYLSLPEGTYYSPCEQISEGISDQSTVEVNVIEKISGEYYLTTKFEYYDDASCSDVAKLATVTNPRSLLSLDGTGVDSATQLPYQKVRSKSNGGAADIQLEPGAPVTLTVINATVSQLSYLSTSGGFSLIKTNYAPSVGYYLFADAGNRTLLKGDDLTADDNAADPYPTALLRTVPLRQFRFFNLAVGTYDSECEPTAIDISSTRYGLIRRQVVKRVDNEYRPVFSTSLIFYQDLACTVPLITLTGPEVRADTVGNGVDADAANALYRKVLLANEAGIFTATIDPAAATGNKVTVTEVASGGVTSYSITFVDDNKTFTSDKDVPAGVSADLAFVAGSNLYLGNSEPGAPVDEFGFPTQLLIDLPFVLQP